MRYWLVRSLSTGNVCVVVLQPGGLLTRIATWGWLFEVLKTGPFGSWAEAAAARAEIEGY